MLSTKTSSTATDQKQRLYTPASNTFIKTNLTSWRAPDDGSPPNIGFYEKSNKQCRGIM